jgi:hypothetical protein
MDRHLWTEADEYTTWRKWAGWKHDLDDVEVLPFHLRDASRDHWRNPSAPRRKGKHAASDEEGSRVLVRVDVVKVVQVLAVAGLVIVGVRAVRSLMGAS